MIIKTITCHDVYNSGAALQAYALQSFLILSGHEVEIIDYKPEYLSNHFNFFLVSNQKYNSNFLIKIAYLLAKLPSRLLTIPKKNRFDQFTKKYLSLTKLRYSSYDDLCDNPPIAQVYIAGSDQIWNTSVLNGLDPAFYLDFGLSNTYKVSYAASFATETLNSEHFAFVQSKLKKINKISVRERNGIDILSSLGFFGLHVCDPVLLLDKQHWCRFIKKSIVNEKYLLIYDFEYNPQAEAIARYISEKNGLMIIAMNTNLRYAKKSYPNIGPIEFLNLIAHAEFVISNSFHATVFSLIFEKKFLVYPRTENINSRMIDLLSFLGLENRYSTEQKIPLEDIDYSIINNKLNEFVGFSQQYLLNSLKESYA